ncbi:hypothetical protein FOQG_00243 [Fusarium oxysporum f. sp. raphani 54005]|uniref:Uncharacterized protein n=3 Tax=Fusarium oxysporum TaxID=5507 RepID=X0E0H9_FUSOX|nr:hypothetical protein FOVG_03333 [Fusarium oxysporum f. sp. pisi HDV247]EXK99852.1 hypothetical protein FOQG_00243 [Fusarium oxysporum f. sp. raphani 54005]EXL82291.1 hypothetical protein FOPG_04878 [Fusarium oxysporum f. sp. conglutinans race 2 54008]
MANRDGKAERNAVSALWIYALTFADVITMSIHCNHALPYESLINSEEYPLLEQPLSTMFPWGSCAPPVKSRYLEAALTP